MARQSQKYFEKEMQAATTGRGKPTFTEKYAESGEDLRAHYGHSGSQNMYDATSDAEPHYVANRYKEYR